MPELPEVHTIAVDLKKNLLGFTIGKVEVESGYKVNPDNQSFAQDLAGSKVEKVGRVGKNIVMRLSGDKYLAFHLAMTGRLLLRPEKTPRDEHQRIQIKLSDGSKNLLLRFCDMRMFGKVGLATAEEIRKLRDKYGPDISVDNPGPDSFLKRLQIKNTGIKNALLEQSTVAGLGNIYATDALWMAKIHPETKTSSMSLSQAKSLLKSAKEVIAEGILHRGSTLPDEAYVDIFGKPGSHQKYFRIYGKAYCPDCKTKVEYKKINGRGTYFCPSCQK